jgi:hypothetical protein
VPKKKYVEELVHTDVSDDDDDEIDDSGDESDFDDEPFDDSINELEDPADDNFNSPLKLGYTRCFLCNKQFKGINKHLFSFFLAS